MKTAPRLNASSAPRERRKQPLKPRAISPANGREMLEREDWLAGARRLLISQGVNAVKIDRLARELGVTRGGFYYRFKSRSDLLNALMEDWRDHNSVATLAAIKGKGAPVDRILALMKVWIEEVDYVPAYDIAMREWGRVSAKVAKLVRAVDDERIEAFHQLFVDAGYPDQEAFIRARVFYYHQVGYYAMGVEETKERRLELADLYFKVLTGFSA
jgi:AcrR family transcriptional regulator